jgi:triacylglycerol lipase
MGRGRESFGHWCFYPFWQELNRPELKQIRVGMPDGVGGTGMSAPTLRLGSVVGGLLVLALATLLSAPAARAGGRPQGAQIGRAAGPDGGPVLTVPAPTLSRSLACVNGKPGHGRHRPVLLVHGTGLTPAQSWAWNYGQVLPAEGYPTCTVALPQASLGDTQIASQYVVAAVDTMAGRLHSSIDIIGHSQGGIEPRWALKWWPGLRTKVDHYIGLASPNHGIYAADACADSGNCWPAVWQMAQGAHFMNALNAGGEAPGPTSYTDIYSLTDDLVQPAITDPTAALHGGSNVANVSVQSVCPGRYVNHGGMLADAVVYALVLDTLAHHGPLDPELVSSTTCTQAFMPGTSAGADITGNAEVYTNAAQAFYAHPGVGSEPPLASYASR